ncbi:hypothetical protein NDU88_001693 [Pleurodeles waltl]|uniref:Uncharacterized protein n=1 Tax=Pleurodeles waltl TaxID=8319 RepID=A0AAV7M3W1_PLEWA|nr:hypothetical protein NDU88_001693 [Pleurodeles waltl]
MVQTIGALLGAVLGVVGYILVAWGYNINGGAILKQSPSGSRGLWRGRGGPRRNRRRSLIGPRDADNTAGPAPAIWTDQAAAESTGGARSSPSPTHGHYANGTFRFSLMRPGRWALEFIGRAGSGQRNGWRFGVRVVAAFPSWSFFRWWWRCMCGATVLMHKRVLFRVDNLAVAQVVNRQSDRDAQVLQLLRVFVLECLQLDIYYRARHVPGGE